MPGGRPTKLTDELCEAICKDVKEGNTLTFSVQRQGITYQTFLNWMKKGKESKTQSGKFFDFFEAIKKAQEEGKNTLVKAIKKAGSKNWQANAWLLERMYPDEFGRRQAVDMKADVKSKQQVEHKGQIKKVSVFEEVDKLVEFVGKGNEDGDQQIQSTDTPG